MFAYLEDNVLFGYLVANEICDHGDAAGLARLQREHDPPQELRLLLGADPTNGDAKQIGEALRSNITTRNREALRTMLRALPDRLRESRSCDAGNTIPHQESVFDVSPLLDELREKRVELGNRERSIGEWASAAVQYLEMLEALIANENLNQDVRSIAERVAKQFARTVEPLGLQVIEPQEGDLFIEGQHIADDGEVACPKGVTPIIARCNRWGYRLPDGTLIKPHVTITQGEEP